VAFQVIPRERGFYDLLEADAEGVAIAAREMRELVGDFEHADAHRRRITELEHRGDDLTHSVLALLNQTFVTPVDRGDIYRLASYLDDVLDSTEAVADLLVLHRIREPIEQLRMQADVLVGATEAVARAVRGLRSFRETDTAGRDIVRFERDGDHVYRAAVAALYSGEHGAMDVLKWRDVLEEMEAAIDRCEDIANTLESIALKYA
jgi:predicted phosphate transport protein (TIGR00153 family)